MATTTTTLTLPSNVDHGFFGVFTAASLCSIVAVLVFSNSLNGEMVFDDRPALVENRDVTQSSPLSGLMKNNFWGQRMDAPDTQHQSYRPLTILTFRWNHHLSGLDPWGFHVVNVGLHAAATGLFVVLLARILSRPSFSLFLLGGLLFATHPIHSESVAGLVGRADTLAAVFFLLSLLVYIRACDSRSIGTQLSWVLLSIVLNCASVLSKEQGVTVVAVATVYDLFFASDLDLRRLVTQHVHPLGKQKHVQQLQTAAPSLSLTGLRRRKSSTNTPSSPTHRGRHIERTNLARVLTNAFLGRKAQLNTLFRLIVLWSGTILILIGRLRMNTQEIHVDAKTNPANHITDPLSRVMTKNLYVSLHAWLLVFPRDLCCDWSGGAVDIVEYWYDIRNIGTFGLYVSLLILGLEICFSKRSQRFKAELALGFTLMVAPFIPATGLFMEVGFVLAERILYIPSLGFCLLVTTACSRFSGAHRFRWRSQLGFVMLGIIFMSTFRLLLRNQDWRNERELYGSGVKVAPNNAKLHHNYAYHITGDEKEYHYREALRLYPPYISAYINLGVHLSQSGRYTEAITTYEKGLTMHEKYPLYSTDVGMIYRNMAQSYLHMEQPDKAIAAYEACVRRLPTNQRCLQLLERLRAQTRQTKSASSSSSESSSSPSSSQSLSGFDDITAVLDRTYKAHRNKYPKTFLMFYAPWCSHCTEMKSDFAKTNAKMAGQVALARVDCTTETHTCSVLKINGYPTLLFFASASDSTGTKYSGDRSEGDMVKFLTREVAMKTKQTITKENTTNTNTNINDNDNNNNNNNHHNNNNNNNNDNNNNNTSNNNDNNNNNTNNDNNTNNTESSDSQSTYGKVTNITSCSFKNFRQKHPESFVMFFAPWCAHCTKLQPSFDSAAKEAQHIAFASVDCTIEATLCTKLEIKAYPTLLHFKTSDDEGTLYNSDSSTQGLLTFLKGHVDDPRISSDVVQLDDSDFDLFRTEHVDSFVMFYAPWCSHCRDAMPAFAKAAKTMKNTVPFATVDCTVARHTCVTTAIDVYPKFLRFSSTLTPSTFQGERDEQSFVEAARQEN